MRFNELSLTNYRSFYTFSKIKRVLRYTNQVCFRHGKISKMVAHAINQ